MPSDDSFDAHALDLLDKMLVLDPSKVSSDFKHLFRMEGLREICAALSLGLQIG